jgi:N-methylhydantoinase A
MEYLVGIDIGGTCTDCVVIEQSGRITVGKAFSTPPDFSRGILDALEVAARSIGVGSGDILAATRLFLHGTTVAENAMVDGNLARAGLITTRGFEQTLFATRGGYGRWSGLTEDEKRDPIRTDKPAPIIPLSRIRGVRERTDHNGRVLARADEEEVRRAVRSLDGEQLEALGISLLWSFVNPGNERIVASIVREMRPDLFVTLSSDIAPVLGEYERSSTVALNVALGPVVARYLNNLLEGLRKLGFAGNLLVMQAHGGLLPFEQAAARPIGMVESGPVGGLVGCKRLGDLIGLHNVISADMGGTTFKVGTVREGLIEYQRESMVLRYHYALPKMDVVSLGLAGGSVISIEPRTRLPRVGPRSAGSFPGPICYDHGGKEPTLTDVDAILGYLNPNYFLGGRAGLNLDLARRGFEELVAKPLGLPPIEAAAAIHKLANAMIYDLLHKTTVQRGLDPREFALFSTGGTAGMHLAAVGEELGVRHIVVPHSASVHGAFGLVTSDIVHEELTTRPQRHPADPRVINEMFNELLERVRGQLAAEGFNPERIDLYRSIDMRYRRQVHILTVPLDLETAGTMRNQPAPVTAESLAASVERFELLYKQKYGADSTFSEAGVELVTFRVRGTGLVAKPELRFAPLGDSDASHAIVERRQAWVPDLGRVVETPGYDFELLRPGNVIPGPAIIWTPITTVVTNSRQTTTCDGLKNLIITATDAAARPGRKETR